MLRRFVLIYQYDKAGWFLKAVDVSDDPNQPRPGYHTKTAPETIPTTEPVEGENYPLWNGRQWMIAPYQPPLPDYVPPAPTEALDKRLR